MANTINELGQPGGPFPLDDLPGSPIPDADLPGEPYAVPSQSLVEDIAAGGIKARDNISSLVADAIGVTVDLANIPFKAAGITNDNPYFGSKWMEEYVKEPARKADQALVELNNYLGLPSFYIPEEPTLGTMIGEETTYALTLGPLFGRLMKAVKPAMSTPGKVLTAEQAAKLGTKRAAVRDAVRSMGDYYYANPVKSALIDLGLAVPAGTGRYVGHKMDPEGRVGGEALGGTAGAMLAPTVFGAVRGVARGVNEATGLSESARTRLAKKQLQNYMTDPKAEIPDKPLYGSPTTGQLLNDPELMAKERYLSRKYVGWGQDKLSESQGSLHQGLYKLDPGGEVDVPVRKFREHVERTADLVDNNVQASINRVQKYINRLSPDSTYDDIMRKAEAELETSYNFARAREHAVWNKIPNVKYNTKAVEERAREIIKTRVHSESDSESMHPLIYKLAKQDVPGDVPTDEGRLFKELDEYVEQTTGAALKETEEQTRGGLREVDGIKEILHMRSRLLKSAKRANKAGDTLKASRLYSLAETIMDDVIPVDADPVTRKIVDEARKLTKDLNDTFLSGRIGNVLGHGATGGRVIAAEETLERLIPPGYAGQRGAGALRETQRFYTELGADEAIDPAIREAMSEVNVDASIEEYLKHKFVDEVMPNGKFNESKARGFVNRYKVLLDYPALRRQMLEAADAQEIYTQADKASVLAIKHARELSAAAKYTKGDPVKQADAILNSDYRTKEAYELMDITKGDAEATAGLQTAFYKSMMRRIAPDQRAAVPTLTDAEGVIMDIEGGLVNAKLLRRFLRQNAGVITAVWGEDGKKLLEEISRGATLAANEGRGVATGGGSDTAQNVAGMGKLKSLAGMIGVVLGSYGGRKVLGTNELLIAGRARAGAERLVGNLEEKGFMSIERLVLEALNDPDFARQLLKTRDLDAFAPGLYSTMLRNALYGNTAAIIDSEGE